MNADNTGLSPDQKGFIIQSKPRPHLRVAHCLIVSLIVLFMVLFFCLPSGRSATQLGEVNTVRSDSATPTHVHSSPTPAAQNSSAVNLEAVEIIVRETVPFPNNCPARIIQGYVNLFAQRAALAQEHKPGEPLDPNSLPRLKHTFPRQSYFLIDGWKLDGNAVEALDAFRKRWPTDDFETYYALTYLLPILEKYPDWQRLAGYTYYRQRIKTQPAGLDAYYADPSAFRETP